MGWGLACRCCEGKGSGDAPHGWSSGTEGALQVETAWEWTERVSCDRPHGSGWGVGT